MYMQFKKMFIILGMPHKINFLLNDYFLCSYKVQENIRKTVLSLVILHEDTIYFKYSISNTYLLNTPIKFFTSNHYTIVSTNLQGLIVEIYASSNILVFHTG